MSSLSDNEAKMLPSPQPSNKGSSSKTSRKTSPTTEDSAIKRRRSNRVAELETDTKLQEGQRSKGVEPEGDISLHDALEGSDVTELILKKRKKEDSTSRGRSRTPQSLPEQKKVITVKDGQLIFNEPPSNEPIMSVTGLPLDALPSSKIKKEALWPRKKVKSGKKKSSPDEDLENSPEFESIAQEEFDGNYKKQLKTTINEELQKNSALRSSHKPVAKNGSESVVGSKRTKLQPPSTPKKRTRDKEENKRKIKNASPKKVRANPFGFDNPLQLAGSKRENAFDLTDATKDNEDFCSSCGEPGIFLCCESCPKSFHFACCDPPYDEAHLPEDEWFCNECETKRNPPLKNNTGLFGKLLNQIPFRNPIQFKLPKKIRDRFERVVTGTYGEYEDTDYKPYKPTVIGAFEQTDPDLHYDKNGKAILCQKCGLSGISPNKLNGEADKLITQCEYCPSAWHLDCLDPPLSTVKQLGKKWKCPNHAEHLMINKQRRLRNPKIIDVDQTAGFKNDGDIEVLLEDEEVISDAGPVVVDISTPAYLNNRDTEKGAAAEIPKSALKLWNDSFVIHRLREKGILIDFLSKVSDEKEKQRQKIEEILRLQKENNDILSHLGDSYNPEEQRTIKSLVDLKDNDFQELLKIASNEIESRTDFDKTRDIPKDEIQELLQIKKLISLKGKDELLKFLKS